MTTKKADLPSTEDTLELIPDEKTVADALVEWFQSRNDWEEIPPELEETLTPENLEAFLMGEKTLAQILGMDPEEAYSIAEMAYSMLEQGNFDDAETLLEGLVVLNPYDAYFHTLLGTVYMHKGRDEEARIEFDTALDLDETQLAAYVNRGEMSFQSGELEAALDDFRRAIELDPDGRDQISNRARMLVSLATVILNQTVAQHPTSSG